MNTLPETILRQAQSLPEGGVLSPKEFLHLGSRSAVDQAFSRLAKAGKLLRVARGAYAAPVSSRFGSRAPAPEKVVQALAEQSGEIVVPHGASAANALGRSCNQSQFRQCDIPNSTDKRTRNVFEATETCRGDVPRNSDRHGSNQSHAAVIT